MLSVAHLPAPPPALSVMRSLLVIVCLATLTSACGVNNIPTYDEAANTAWGELHHHYQQRADLAPELITVVEDVLEQTPQTLVELLAAHKRIAELTITPDTLSDEADFASFANAQTTLASALESTTTLSNTYVKLDADQRFATLLDQLRDTTNRITVAQGDYVQAVRRYNTELRTIPGKWWYRFVYPEMRTKQHFYLDQADAGS